MRGTRANIAIASSLAKEAGDTSTVGSHRAYPDGRSGKDKYDNGKPSTEGRVSSKEPIHYGCKQKREQELLHM